MRKAFIERKTGETDIRLGINLDGQGEGTITTGIGFFDHMLDLLSRHGLMDLDVQCFGDVHVDSHHTVEDVGIVLGQAIGEALGDKVGIARYGTYHVPMDEALVMVSLDISNRPYLVCDLDLSNPLIGNFETEMVEEFFRAVSQNAGITLHIKMIHGKNTHHIIEAAFKAFGRALRMAVAKDPRVKGVPSTKGIL